MLSKLKINIIVLLCILSLISVGFSSWSITIDDRYIDGNISTDNVINSEDYIYLDTTKGDNNTGISCFKYKKEGYLGSDNNITDKGYIDAYFIIDLNKCKTLFANSNALDLTIILKYAENNPTSLNIFEEDRQDTGYRTLNYNIITNNSNHFVVDTAYGTENRQYALHMIISDILTIEEELINFQIRYTFFATVGEYFENNIYTKLYGDNVKFSIAVSIMEGN